MENYLNIVHFCLYKFLYRLHLVTEKINPFRLLFKIPIVRKKAKEQGVDLQKSINEAWGNEVYGLSVSYAGGLFGGIIALFFFSLLILFDLNISVVSVVGCGILSAGICYMSVFKNDKYISYFKKYANWSRIEKRRYSWLTFGSILVVFILFYIGLIT